MATTVLGVTPYSLVEVYVSDYIGGGGRGSGSGAGDSHGDISSF
jgi:hypothetical protein